jgi:hypothetical protein
MPKSFFKKMLAFTFIMAALITVLSLFVPPLWGPTALVYAATWTPFAIFAFILTGQSLYERFRAPDVVIEVIARLTPLEAKFIEQDRRLERRERLKGEVFQNECEVERFNANLTPDERKAWQNRPGPFGKM